MGDEKPVRVEKPWGHELIWARTDRDILEASTPELDDVVRLEDRYGRVK
jgi:mannose-6-phosphate isomerase